MKKHLCLVCGALAGITILDFSAFAGTEKTLAAYRHAVEAGYRFFSYGDCMFIA